MRGVSFGKRFGRGAGAFALGFAACGLLVRLLIAQPVGAASPGSFNLGTPARVVQAVQGTVVNLESYGADAEPPEGWLRFFKGPVPAQAEPNGVASGVIVSPEGYIVTNNHVVSGAERIRVRFADDHTAEARVVGTDPHTDLAVVRVRGGNFPYARFGDSQALVPGDSVVAIGNPLGFANSVSVGVVSATRAGPLRVGDQTLGDMIQTDAAINQGNSGGGLFAADGRLIGINTAIMVTRGSSGSIGIGFAVPAHRVKPVVDTLIREGKVRRPWLGIRYRPSEGGHLEHTIRTGIGVMVEDVVSGSPAFRSGLRSADILQRLGNCPIRSSDDLYCFVDRYRAGETVAARVLRAGKPRTITLRLTEAPG